MVTGARQAGRRPLREPDAKIDSHNLMTNAAAFLLTVSLGTAGSAAAAGAAERLVEGNSSSPVRVVVYEDLQCADCATFRVMMDQHLLSKYGSRVAFEHRDFPLPKHAWARRAAIAARYFETIRAAAGTAWRRYALANLGEITSENFTAKLEAFARSQKADPHKAVAALDDKRLVALVEADYQEGVARGIARTPTVLVNGEPFIESFTVEEISKGIDEALKAGAGK
jgi:protein-disulfide isomerase